MSNPTYDGSTGSLPQSHPLAGLDSPPEAQDFGVGPVDQPHYAPGSHVGANNGGSEVSSLAQLRERQAQRDQAPIEPWIREVPGLGLRLVCDPVIDHQEFRKWMKAAQDKKKSTKGAQGTDMDTLMLSALAMSRQNRAIEINTRYGAGGEPNWEPISDPAGGPMTLESHALLREYGVLTPVALVQKLFVRDAYAMKAGQDFLEAAGYGDDDPEE